MKCFETGRQRDWLWTGARRNLFALLTDDPGEVREAPRGAYKRRRSERRWFSGRGRHDPEHDRGRVDDELSSQTKALVSCLREHIKPSVADVIVLRRSVVISPLTRTAPASGLEVEVPRSEMTRDNGIVCTGCGTK
ncbi:hypothetical protein EVAR_53561_1 [Eumeta japonica]|uniref:Uncharacterized protein n=1 Tax=Eumeta variegata TaxID=151549 RepID=A0A4C1YV17_EUMVA|nr:hypothetical protein EVAR_53561_1 [Eumeta japonica]